MPDRLIDLQFLVARNVRKGLDGSARPVNVHLSNPIFA